MNLALVLILIVLIVAMYFISVFNTLSRLKIRITEAWSQIDVQLKRRTDLIPNLIETVKGYVDHEKDVFANVTKAREALISATNAKEASDADNMLTGALKSLFALAEAYPDLKAQEGFVNLQRELSDTEDKVSYARQFYNNIVRQYNESIAVFPSNFISKMFGFTKEEFFEIAEEDKEPVKVDFNSKSRS